MSDDITVVLNGSRYFGWTSAEVTASISDATRTFSVTMAEADLGALGDSFWTAPGDEVEVFCGERSVLRGFVNEYAPEFDANSHTVTITGRGKSQDCVDCSAAAHPTGRFENMTVLAIANALAGVVSISVSSIEATPTVSKFQVNQGETIVRAIHRLAHAYGYSLTGLADGNMALIRGTKDNRYEGVYLQQGAWPLLSAKAKISDQKRFSNYDLKTQLSGAQPRYGVNASAEVAKVTDSTVTRYRPYVGLMSVSTDSQAAHSAADWHARRISGKGVQVEVVVQGFFFAGEIWEPNRLVYLNSSFLKCDHELLIESVTYRRDDAGSTTSMKLVPPKTASSKSSDKPASATAGGGDGSFEASTPSVVPTPRPADPGEYYDWADYVGAS